MTVAAQVTVTSEAVTPSISYDTTYALSPAGAAFSTDYPTTVLNSSPTLYWKLNETSGTAITDSSGNANSGTTSNSPTLNQTGASTPGGPSIKFLRASSQGIASNATVSVAVPFSVEVWVNLLTWPPAGDSRILCKGNGTDNWALWLHNNTGIRFRFASTDMAQLYYNWATGVFYHVVVTIDASKNANMYVQGRREITLAAIGGTNANNTGLIYVAKDSGGNYLNGYVAHAAIYPSVLTEDVVKQHYQAGAQYGVKAGDANYAHRLNRVWTNEPVAFAPPATGGGITNFAY